MVQTDIDNDYLLGIDIGGSHITAALVDLKNRRVLPHTKVRRHVDSKGSDEAILNVWKEAIKQVYAIQSVKRKCIGFAMPGPFNYSEGIALFEGVDKYESIYGLSIRNILTEHFRLNPSELFFRNDAEAFLHGEAFCGAAKGYQNIIGITLGTGLGSAKSFNGVAEDVNLAQMPFYGGVAEDYISIRWFVKRYYELTGKVVQDVKELANNISFDHFAKSIFLEFSKNLALFLNIFIEKYQPELVVVGGNIAQSLGLFLPELKKHLSSASIKVSINQSQLWEDAALIGAVCNIEHQLTSTAK